MNVDFHPKFSRSFMNGSCSILDAVARYDDAVKKGTFPTAEESYS
jgi:ketopantoate hydroxymethyltransferase